MALEVKDLEPISQGISEIKTEQKNSAVSVTEVKQIATEAKTEIAAIKTDVETVKTETTSLKQWQVTKDEADKKNQEALDKLLIEQQKSKIIIPDKPQTFGDSLSQALNEGENFKLIDMLATGHKERKKRFIIELKAAADISTGNITGDPSVYGRINRGGIIEPPKRKVHVRDIIPVGNLGPGNTYTFMYEATTGEGDIAPVAEGAAKPQFDMDLVEKTINIETLAGWVRFTKKAMNNIPGFIAWLQSRLPERLLRVEDSQILTGDGNTPNISGIMDAGNYTAATSTADVLVEQLIDSLAQLEDDEERTASAGLLRPVDYYSFFKNKAGGSGEYDLPQNVTFDGGVLRISGVPFYSTTALTSGKYIVGDFQFGIQLLIQNAMRIEFAEQDADNFTKNKITARIEEDIALPIYGDNYMILGDVPPAGS